MTREEVLMAADERQERGQHEMVIARWLRKIATSLYRQAEEEG